MRHPPVGHCDTPTRTIRHCNDSPHVMLRPCDPTSACFDGASCPWGEFRWLSLAVGRIFFEQVFLVLLKEDDILPFFLRSLNVLWDRQTYTASMNENQGVDIRLLLTSDSNPVVLQSRVPIRRLPSPQLTTNLLVGCHLGWHLAAG